MSVATLCVFDVMVPKLDGYELTRRLRAREETRAIPIILLTASVQEINVQRGFEAGACASPSAPRSCAARPSSDAAELETFAIAALVLAAASLVFVVLSHLETDYPRTL